MKVNGVDRSAFIDFGSQCTMINKSSFSELDLTLELSKLPLLKGFAFGSMQPLGRVQINVSVDFVEAEIDPYVVPDEFLNYDLLLGQNLTEIPDMIAHKTSTSLTLYSDISNVSKIELYNKCNMKFQGMCSIEVTCKDRFTGHLYVSGCSCFKLGEEFMLLPGVFSIVKGVG